jgi:hypothetical protein
MATSCEGRTLSELSAAGVGPNEDAAHSSGDDEEDTRRISPGFDGSRVGLAQARTDALRELLKAKYQEGADLLTHYLRAFVIYVAVTGALLKFALDEHATTTLLIAMAALGLAISALGCAMLGLGEHLRRLIRSDIDNLGDLLCVPRLSSNQVSLKYVLLSSLLFVTIVIAGWIYLLLKLALN